MNQDTNQQELLCCVGEDSVLLHKIISVNGGGYHGHLSENCIRTPYKSNNSWPFFGFHFIILFDLTLLCSDNKAFLTVNNALILTVVNTVAVTSVNIVVL